MSGKRKLRGEQWTIPEGEALALYRERTAELRDAWAAWLEPGVQEFPTERLLDAMGAVLDIDGFSLDDIGQ